MILAEISRRIAGIDADLAIRAIGLTRLQTATRQARRDELALLASTIREAGI
jgi:hypothetical protein